MVKIRIDKEILSEEAKREIEQARAEIKAGKCYTLEQVEKMLKLK